MDISVIICTYNRCHNLIECISLLENQSIDNKIAWEIIFVDNNSSDETKDVIADISKNSSLNIRYIFEEKQGLSTARNKGINEANGDFLIFIDDDIRVSENWLQSIYTTFKTFNCDAVGGRIHIESPQELPKWITPDMYGFLGHQDFGDTPHPMDGIKEFPFGGNMAIQRGVIDKVGFFDVSLGRKGTGLEKEELFKGEETDFFRRLAEQGGTFYYQPDALVLHKILPHQLKRSFFLTLHTNAGIQKARLDNFTYNRTFARIPLFLFLQLFRSIVNYIIASSKQGLSNSFRQLMTVFYFIGMMNGYFNKK